MQPPAYDPDRVPSVVPEIEPDTSIPKTIGTLNIIFGACLLLCGICSGVYQLSLSAMGPMMAVQQEQLQQAVETERKAQLQKLEERAKATQDAKEKAELQAQQKALQAQPVPKMPDMTRFMRDVRFQGYMLADVVTGSLLNIVMLVSGIGLLGLKKWGRLTAIWVAALKIIRLVALYGFFALVVAPVVAQQFTTMIEEMAKAAPPGQKQPSPEDLAAMTTGMGVTMTASAIGMIVLGSIYPVIVLILLTRPRVRAACAAPLPGLRD